jgi:hypothetical protein
VSPLLPGDLITLQRPTAEAAQLLPGTPIWYRQPISGGYGHCYLVPGVFEHYANLRIAVVLRDASGRDHRVYVSSRNVYPRWPEDGPHASEGVQP